MTRKNQFSKALILTLSLALMGMTACSGQDAVATTASSLEATVAQTEKQTEATTQEATTQLSTEAVTTQEATTQEATTEAETQKATESTESETEADPNMIEITCPVTYTIKRNTTTYGTIQKDTYYSTTCEKERPVNVVLPANYDPEKKYPVMYILHGIFGDQNSMLNGGNSGAPVILGNMMADGTAEEMILVFPYMYASKTQDQCTKIDDENTAAYDNFVNDLRDDLMPYIQEKYSVLEGRENTAVMGFSMGGRETLAIGLSLQDRVGYICAIAPAPGLVEGTDWAMHHKGQFLEDELKFETDPILFMLCSGDKDSVVGKFPMSYHEIFERNGVEHTWWIIPGSDHGDPAISSGIYNFGRRVFKAQTEEVAE